MSNLKNKSCFLCGDIIWQLSEYCSKCAAFIDRMSRPSPNWCGGKVLDSKGYIKIYAPHHENANKAGYIFEHRLMMETKIGRKLLKTEVVHHKNGMIQDNRIENLELFSSKGEHSSLHKRGLI